MTSVAYPGTEAAHTAAAAEQLFPDAEDLVAHPTFAAVARAVSESEVAYGVLPIENSLVGPIAETHDLLWQSPLSIVGETTLRIRHHAVARWRVALEDVHVVRSHPAALEQCRRFLESLPRARVIAASTTAAAAADVAASGRTGEVAIASDRAAALYGLKVIASNVGDHPEAYTRFVSLAPHTRLDWDGSEWRTAFSFVTAHEPGALLRALEPFAEHGLNLIQLVSRPMPEAPWTYRFDGVLAGHPQQDEQARVALREVQARVRKLRIFGSYPAGA